VSKDAFSRDNDRIASLRASGAAGGLRENSMRTSLDAVAVKNGFTIARA